MDCAEEVSILKRRIGPLVGGAERLSFDILRGKMIVFSDADPDLVCKAVANTGMRAEAWDDPKPASGTISFWQRGGRTTLTTASAAFLAAAFIAHALSAHSFVNAILSEATMTSQPIPVYVKALYLAAIIAGSWFILPKAWLALKQLRPDMNLLIILAVIGAAGIGQWFEAATVAFLFALSLTLESWSVGRARRAVEALLAIAPPTVRLLREGVPEEEVSPEDVPVGAHFLVRPGERIPLDGVVFRGYSEVNQAPITGESVPVAKEPGSQIFAGTINGHGALEIASTKLAGETTLAQIIRMVGEAQSRRAPSEQWVDRFAQTYTPIIFALAFLVAIIPPVFLGGAWSDWLYRSLVLLVIGCPCALVISTPVSIVAGLAAAAKNGVLVKGGIHMESPARLRAVAFDKTGTLTKGEPSVVEVVPMSGHSTIELLELAGTIERHSDHPLARAVVAFGEARNVSFGRAEAFEVIPGKGAAAQLNGRTYWLGSHRYLEERGQETAEVHDRLEELSRAGKTVVVIGNEEHVCGFIALGDAVRPGATTAIKKLTEQRIGHVAMLTGDNRGTAETIARELGIDTIYAELLPGDKVEAVERLVQKYQFVAMVGDGINDAPAMGRATLAIAMGAAGSDTAIEAADVALMSDDLEKIPWLITHSRRVLAIIRQNIALSLAVKAAFMVLTFLGHASLWAAIAADMGVSFLVITNALRLLRRCQAVRAVPEQLCPGESS
jgi:Cd2+/Zn2+-exporting ATPase